MTSFQDAPDEAMEDDEAKEVRSSQKIMAKLKTQQIYEWEILRERRE